MQGYGVRKGNQFYAVIYEGRDPITGRERRRWHPAGPNRGEAEALARALRASATQLRDAAASPSACTSPNDGYRANR